MPLLCISSDEISPNNQNYNLLLAFRKSKAFVREATYGLFSEVTELQPECSAPGNRSETSLAECDRVTDQQQYQPIPAAYVSLVFGEWVDNKSVQLPFLHVQ